ncbi:DUF7504 family protein [Halorussus caseinilyticus]|uniref:Uncharacterized protein n=1 Tax=Halorussus caseinilyticus TaxID=3034025 RepID=A0ABD5WE16_9EURY|nr:hypothetical protein [Halorussus sp. DT72]
MTTGQNTRQPDGGPPPDDDFNAFLGILNQLKATGCAVLVVGDAPRELFTRASGQLLGDPETVRHRVLAVTDATSESVAERLPDRNVAPRPLAETTRLVNHAHASRSITAASEPTTRPKLDGIREVRVSDPELEEFRTGLVDAIDGAAESATALSPADLRVGIDSLVPLLERYHGEAVARCLDAVGRHVRSYDGMAHFVLPDAYESDRVQALRAHVEAVIELRAVDPSEYGHDTQQRWHVPQQDITTKWTPL